MTYQDMWSLPDPETQPEFYADTPAKRLFAWIVDMVVTGLITVLILPFTAFVGIFFFPFLMALVGFAYRVVTIANGSATLGMRLMAIELRTASGLRFGLPEAVWHTTGLYVSFAVFPLQLVSIVLMLTTARAQGLTDHIMGSVVLNRRAGF